MINIETEALLSLSEAARSIPAIDGRRPHISTIFRWMTSGIRGGVKLEHARIGRRIVTSKEAISRFVNDLSQVPAPAPAPAVTAVPTARTPRQRERDIAAAKARLVAAGVLDEGAA